MDEESLKLKPTNNSKNKYNADDNKVILTEDDDYDPHDHRKVEHPTTNNETLIHLLKGCLGTGILAMPEAFMKSGLWNGMVCTFLIGALCTYGLHLLVQMQYVLCKRLKVSMLTYPESMKIALNSGPKCLNKFANMSPIIVDIFLVTYQLGICCVYVVFVGKNVKGVVDSYYPNPEDRLSITTFILIFLVPFILINCVRNLKLLAPFSTLANIITFASFGVVCYYVFQDLPDISTYPVFGTAYDFPLFFGTTLFALEAVGVVIALENNMKTPKGFGGWFGVLNVGMGLVTALYAAMGFFGYWKYGNAVKSSITLNFEQSDKLAKAVKILYSIAIYISFGLQGYPPVEILWKTYILKRLEGSNHLLLWEYGLRIFTVLLTVALASVVPLLGLFISLFGAFCLSALGIAFPAIIELCVKWPDQLGRGKWILIKDILLIIFGLVGLVAGSYSALSDIIIKLKKGELE